jgi:hypothetical protein
MDKEKSIERLNKGKHSSLLWHSVRVKEKSPERLNKDNSILFWCSVMDKRILKGSSKTNILAYFVAVLGTKKRV